MQAVGIKNWEANSERNEQSKAMEESFGAGPVPLGAVCSVADDDDIIR